MLCASGLRCVVQTLLVPDEYAEAYRNADFWRLFLNRGTAGIDGITADRHFSGKTYNLQGVEVGDDYKGIVIRNGKKLLKR